MSEHACLYSHLMPDDGAPPRNPQWSGPPLRVEVRPDVAPKGPSPDAVEREIEIAPAGAGSIPPPPNPSPSEEREEPKPTDAD